MAEHIKITPSNGTWVARAAGAVVAESDHALVMHEGDYPPVIYFPRDDVAMAFFEKTEKKTVCPHKGDASYFSLHGKSRIEADVAWSYETPHAPMAAIAGHIAFYTDRVVVEEL